jgi:flagellar basal body rod protein FlgG
VEKRKATKAPVYGPGVPSWQQTVYDERFRKVNENDPDLKITWRVDDKKIMLNGLSSSLAGLTVFGNKLSNAADNIVNSSTSGYKKTASVITEDAAGLPELHLERVTSPGALFQESDGTMTEQPNVDFAEELTQTIVAQRGYEANLKALKAQSDMLGSLLDVLV